MKCPKCQPENSEDARFCNGYGHNLTILSGLFPQNLYFDEKTGKINKVDDLITAGSIFTSL